MLGHEFARLNLEMLLHKRFHCFSCEHDNFTIGRCEQNGSLNDCTDERIPDKALKKKKKKSRGVYL
jgi:hypothetical protein